MHALLSRVTLASAGISCFLGVQQAWSRGK